MMNNNSQTDGKDISEDKNKDNNDPEPEPIPIVIETEIAEAEGMLSTFEEKPDFTKYNYNLK